MVGRLSEKGMKKDRSWRWKGRSFPAPQLTNDPLIVSAISVGVLRESLSRQQILRAEAAKAGHEADVEVYNAAIGTIWKSQGKINNNTTKYIKFYSLLF
jgi:hypothetical protein